MSAARRNMKMLFLGQCLQMGYEGVPTPATYPRLAHAALSARFPDINFIFDITLLGHPTGLKTLLRYRLAAFKPDVVVISTLATFTATDWKSGILYAIAPEIALRARLFLKNLDAKFRRGPLFGKLLDQTQGLRPELTHPPLQLDEYERILEDGINQCHQTSSCRVVLMGPGGFNEDTRNNFRLQSPKLWSSVNQMVLRLAKRLDVPVINTQEALHEYSGEVYLPYDHRLSLYGQAVVAREVEAVLAAQVVLLLHDHTDDLPGKLRRYATR